MKHITLLNILFFVSIFSIAQSNKNLFTNSLQCSPKREVRAVWLTTIGGLDWPKSYAKNAAGINLQKRDLCKLLDQYSQAGINTVLLQTRVRGTMIYPSSYEPWDGCLSGTPGISPGYDALAFAIAECHKRGMELHAWIVCIPIGKWNLLGAKSLRIKYPKLVKKIDAEGFMNPEQPQTANYIANIAQEIAQNYDVDGIHLDYIRYPETWKEHLSSNIGRQNITRIVKAVHDKVRPLKPWVKLSCSPIGKYNDLSRYSSRGWNAYQRVYQDAQQWLKLGYMDQLYPMLYFKDNNFFPFAINWQEESSGKMIVPGLGIYFMSPNERNWSLEVIKQELQVLRSNGMGHAYFRGKFFTDNLKGIYDFAKNDFTQYQALIPAMTWIHDVAPSAPSVIKIDNKTSQLSWSGAIDYSKAPYLLYNVYASKQAPVDINDARNLVAMRITATSIKIPTTKGMAFAVTAMDRFGNESEPIQSHQAEKTSFVIPNSLLKCNNYYVEIPPVEGILDEKFVIIETLQKGLVKSLPIQNQKVDISTLSDGMYILKSIKKKGHIHRLGQFMIKRK